MIKDNQKNSRFVPWSHENLELKNELLNMARQMRLKTGFENQLAATFIYISFVEYLANNLLGNLRYYTYIGSYTQYAGIIFIDERQNRKTRTLGQAIEELTKYQLPDKDAIIELIKIISVTRNKIFHSFATCGIEELKKIVDEDLIDIQEKSEELLQKINIVYVGMQKILLQEHTDNEGTA